MKKQYTVVLMYPDYLAESFGQDTYTAHVEAAHVDAAVRAAQVQVMQKQAPRDRHSCHDFFPVATFEGHHPNLTLVWN